ncbi:hypothetical protein TorRG33x02_268380 [Trema orientale]|uniref:Uncharacterized protein n=1 Tax=Trema orientale TaxID=63057 RepID=A0A2P5CZB4_TREOI|nr:hypothetical protein TorRG33x02_268380 [Trema orientale]
MVVGGGENGLRKKKKKKKKKKDYRACFRPARQRCRFQRRRELCRGKVTQEQIDDLNPIQLRLDWI